MNEENIFILELSKRQKYILAMAKVYINICMYKWRAGKNVDVHFKLFLKFEWGKVWKQYIFK